MATGYQVQRQRDRVARLEQELEEAKHKLAELEVQLKETSHAWLPGRGWVERG